MIRCLVTGGGLAKIECEIHGLKGPPQREGGGAGGQSEEGGGEEGDAWVQEVDRDVVRYMVESLEEARRVRHLDKNRPLGKLR